MVWPTFDLVGQHYGALPPDAGGSGSDAVISDEVTAEERTQIRREIEANRKRLIESGQLPSASKTAVVSFDWPLRAGGGLSDPGYHTSGAYVDQDRNGGSKLDYNCGQHTYDNHRGVDYGSWPFWWYKMDHDQVEIVAAAAGTIVSRTDGNFDRSCTGGGGWNAVYVEHADGSVAWYGHLKNDSVTPKSVGESVAQGEYLGVMGSSGNSTGPHLHFEVYDAAGSLIDPYWGACNSMNATSWWADQPPYRDSAINALYTHGALPVFPDCPQQETPNLKDTFLEGETFYSAAYFRNIQPGMQTEYQITTPSGTTWSSWTHTYNGSNECQVCWWVWGWGLPSEAPTGTWTFEADFNGESYSHPFEVTTPPPFEGGLLASAGPLDGKATCGGGGSYEVNVIDGVITRVGDTGYKHLAVGSSCWRFPDQYTRVYVTANDPALFDHWESPSGHIGFINGHNGTTTTTVETSFNTNSTSPTFQAIHTGGSPTPDLLTVDETTGLGSVVGALSGGSSPAYPALAVHPTTGLVYAGGGGGSPTLYQVDATTGSLGIIGPAGGSIARYGGMDFRSDGTLFASVNVTGLGGQGANHLATVNLTTGTATVIGPFGSCGGACSLEGMEGLAFDDSGTLYGTLHYRGAAGAPGLYTINTSTGAATFVSAILSSGSPPSGGITGLQFADGTLYGGTALAVTPATDGGRLVQINKSTGAFSFVGGVSATGGRGLNGLALGLPPDILASVKVFLEGAYAGAGRMAVGATFEASQPLAQPYSDPAFNGTPLDHDSTVVVTALPDTTIDWVLVSLRTGTGAATEVPDSERPALVLTDGSVVDTNGTTLRFPGVTAGPYRLVLRHRNHLSVMSSDTLDLSDGFGSWDFTTAMTQAFTTGPAPMKDLGDGKFGMFAADASVDGQITASDFNVWLVDTKAVSTGYHQTDFNLDGQTTAADFNLWLVNTKAVAESQVPDP